MTTTLLVLTVCGIIQSLLASLLVVRFVDKRAFDPQTRPPVTVLKPLHGDEPCLAEALESVCAQAYPNFQIVFGVQDAADPAVKIVEEVRRRFPSIDMTLTISPKRHGSNGKVNNLINMLPFARHDVLVIADSDVHVAPDWLDRLVAALEQPNVGLVTTLYAGVPVVQGIIGRLAGAQITHGFLPSAVMARALGRDDCLGATMMLRRNDLERIGGLPTLVNHLADDQVLGRRIAALGLQVVLAQTVVLTTVPETRIGALVQHELRWARTIRTLEPLGFAASVLQYPLAWALATVLASGGATWSIGLFMVAWLSRAIAGITVDQALARLERPGADPAKPDVWALAFSCPVWLLPMRDILSVAIMIASYTGRRVSWRGHKMVADTPKREPAPILPHSRNLKAR
jgi:ceramide glucosyltransferase